MSEKRAWKLRPGSNDKTVHEILITGKVRLDYEVPGLRPDMTRKELVSLILAHIRTGPTRVSALELVNSSPCSGT